MPDAAPSPDVAALAKQLGSRYASARIEAVHALREMGPHATTDLLELYWRECEWLAGRRRSFWSMTFVHFLALAFLVTGFGVVTDHLPSSSSAAATVGIGVTFLVLINTVFAQHARLVARASHALALVGDKRAVGTLAEELARASESDRPIVVAGLIRLLPEVGEEDGALLDAAQRRALAIELERGCAQWVDLHPDMLPLGVAICGALARIGDLSAMERLRRVADLPVRTAPQARLQRAVVACLEVLRQREAEGRDAATLLRATSSPDAAVLMRPAGAPTAHEDTLLRPSDDHAP